MVKPTLLIAALLGTGCLEEVSVGLSQSTVLADAGVLRDAGKDAARLDGAVHDASLVGADASERDASSTDAGLYQACSPGQCAIFGISMSGQSTPSCEDGGLAQCLQTATEPCNWICL